MKNKKLRSAEWFGENNKMGFVHRSWMRNQGHPDHMFEGKPVIGICNTWSDLTPCNAHLKSFAEIVKRGVYEAGGFPLEFPVMSLGETLMKPTTMLYRNLIYTGLTRTRNLTLFIGTRKVFAMPVRQQDTAKKQTAL